LMESATSHLASCVTCAAAARELSEETALDTAALDAEFEVVFPRTRCASASMRPCWASASPMPDAAKKPVCSVPRQCLQFQLSTYFGLRQSCVVLAFGTSRNREVQAVGSAASNRCNTDKTPQLATPSPDNSKRIEVATEVAPKQTQSVAVNTHRSLSARPSALLRRN
jgi:hypothetical protein